MALDNTEVTMIDALEEKLAEAENKASRYRHTLLNAADRLAEIGLIDSSPYAKRLFVSGEREL